VSSQRTLAPYEVPSLESEEEERDETDQVSLTKEESRPEV
jgi:hypothetical protein